MVASIGLEIKKMMHQEWLTTLWLILQKALLNTMKVEFKKLFKV